MTDTDQQNIDIEEHMRLIYIIEGLQDELAAACDSLEHYKWRDQKLKRLLAVARISLRREARRWFVHGAGLGFVVGFITGWFMRA